MWIKTKDKKTLVDVSKIKLVKSFGKYYLTGAMVAQGSLEAGEELGKYESEVLAENELKAIENCIRNGENFYEMK
ncbi:hypothetical protein J1N10_11640 [Carboxylicivirga sp. A043]|uniref:hypothetical protein n=1 Tax=Carboxylicivirga litoralis TaxID=2816963 RepID=UPI0021CB1921|nr:hypothetical protein [Carboxylicivirga sp. A043]MCU4156631.1 hypothetical protein [Carboxylicivirga sp. A043]